MKINTAPSPAHKLQPLFIREVVIKAIRTYFDKQNFHEVITPVLNRALPLEPNLYSFATNWEYLDTTKPLYLPTSPESALKKLLAKGVGNCYSIAHSFRNQEAAGSQHNPEFLMLEWYREDATFRNIMEDVRKFLSFVAERVAEFDSSTKPRTAVLLQPWQSISLAELFEKQQSVSLQSVITDETLVKLAQAKGYTTTNSTWSQLFDQIFLNELEPLLPDTPFFLTDFPARTSPLSKPQAEKPWLAERFEVYVGGMELGNGNTENTNAEQVRAVFEAEQAFRSTHNLPTHPIDQEFLSALQTLSESKKSYAGIGLGVERLAMLCAGVDIGDLEI
jgi:elongation factor P--(R)-beta-lysine ligase